MGRIWMHGNDSDSHWGNSKSKMQRWEKAMCKECEAFGWVMEHMEWGEGKEAWSVTTYSTFFNFYSNIAIRCGIIHTFKRWGSWGSGDYVTSPKILS